MKKDAQTKSIYGQELLNLITKTIHDYKSIPNKGIMTDDSTSVKHMARKISNHDEEEQNEMIMKYLKEIKKKIILNVNEGKSRASIEDSTSKEGTSSSLAKARKPISMKLESRANQVPSGTKVFSSFLVDKQHPKEEEYIAFTRYVYNLLEESGETFGVLGTRSLFPRISIFPNGSPGFTAQLFEFGYLDRVYAKQDQNELSQLPAKFIAMECKDLQAYYPTLNYISIEKIKDFNVKPTDVDKKLLHLNKKWIQTRRTLGIKAVIDQDQDWVLITKEKSKSKELKDRILDIELHRLGATEET
ncbi:hypothetical protein H5410_000888 [Solanum commersonii]|uniref:Uncharacterized protein n=1 Tax=Solanum commersonii TaxID=4109 RepID=A0A9J6AY64_SOLCO|nr:hypothetical protein H5410_000888 [Solanum commersonii]